MLCLRLSERFFHYLSTLVYYILWEIGNGFGLLEPRYKHIFVFAVVDKTLTVQFLYILFWIMVVWIKRFAFLVHRYVKQFAKLRSELTDKLFKIYNNEVFKNKVRNYVLIKNASFFRFQDLYRPNIFHLQPTQ